MHHCAQEPLSTTVTVCNSHQIPLSPKSVQALLSPEATAVPRSQHAILSKGAGRYHCPQEPVDNTVSRCL